MKFHIFFIFEVKKPIRMKTLIFLLTIMLCFDGLIAQLPARNLDEWALKQNKNIATGDVAEYIESSSKSQLEITYGDENIFNFGRIFTTDVTSLTSNKFVVVYRDIDNGRKGTAIVGTISGTTISYGPKIIFNSEPTVWPRITCLDSTHIAISYGDSISQTNFDGAAIIGEVSGTNISFGDEYVFSEGPWWCWFHFYTIEALNPNLFVLAFQDINNSAHATSIAAVVSGNTITYGNEFVFAYFTPTSTPLERNALTRIDTNHFIVSYSNHDTNLYSASRVGTVSGDSIYFGPEYQFSLGRTNKLSSITLDSTHFINAYVDMDNSECGTSIIGTITGDSISYSPEFIFYPGWTNYISAAVLDENHFIVTCMDWVNNIHHGTAYAGRVSGNSITYGAPYPFSPGYAFFIESDGLDTSRFVIVYIEEGYDKSTTGRAIVGTVSSDEVVTTASSITTCPESVMVPILVQDMEDIVEFSLILNYDTTYLSYIGYQNVHPELNSDTLFVTDDEGEITTTWNSATTANIGQDTLIEFEFIASPVNTPTIQFLNWDTSSYYIDSNSLFCETVFIDGQIIIQPLPGQPQMPQGPETIYLGGTQTSNYTIYSVSNATAYAWYLIPEEAGNIEGTDTVGTVTWNNNFTGVSACVYAIAKNECGQSISDSLEISISPVLINDPNNDRLEIIIAPNPTSGLIIVSIIGITGYFDLSIFNIHGGIILSKEIHINEHKKNLNLDLNNERSGIYYLIIKNDKKVLQRKIILKN